MVREFSIVSWGDRITFRSRTVTIKPDQELIYGIKEQLGYAEGLK